MKGPFRYTGAIVLGLVAIAAIWHAWVEPNLHHERGSSRVVRIGTNRALGTVIPYIAQDAGFYTKADLRAEIVDFNDVTTLMESFSAGKIDVALVGIAPSAIWQMKGIPLKVIASANGGGHVLMTRADTGIRSLPELRGRKVATPKPGTTTDSLFRALLMKQLAGLDPDKDIQIVPNMAAADLPTVLFVSREVDAAITWEPYASEAEEKYKGAVVLYDAAAEWRRQHPGGGPLYPVNVVIARQEFLDQHPDLVRSFLLAHVTAIDFINNHPEQANPLIGKALQLDAKTITDARRRIDFTANVDTSASLETLEWSRSLGYLKKLPTAKELFDLSFLPKEQR